MKIQQSQSNPFSALASSDVTYLTSTLKSPEKPDLSRGWDIIDEGNDDTMKAWHVGIIGATGMDLQLREVEIYGNRQLFPV